MGPPKGGRIKGTKWQGPLKQGELKRANNKDRRTRGSGIAWPGGTCGE